MTHADIITAIEGMTILELVELVKEMERSLAFPPLLPSPLLLAPPPALPLKPLKRRPSSTSFSPTPAPRRSRSSRSSAKSFPASA